jgi:two-component system cell cycle sensor histidine kinase/response regulator CckA
VDQPVQRGPELMPAGDYVLIEVVDTGTGIGKENLARIFEPFFSTKEVGAGTGLGLSTVYGIVRQTDGFIFVESEPGQGAIFSIYLPRIDADPAAETKRPAQQAETSGADLTGSGTILLVEDEDAVRLFGARALRNKGYTVIEARSGEQAMEVLNGGEPIQVLISDVVMPGMDGVTLARFVRMERPAIKVILISGYSEDVARDGIDPDAGIHFLPKPFSLKQLAGAVKQVMEGG